MKTLTKTMIYSLCVVMTIPIFFIGCTKNSENELIKSKNILIQKSETVDVYIPGEIYYEGDDIVWINPDLEMGICKKDDYIKKPFSMWGEMIKEDNKTIIVCGYDGYCCGDVVKVDKKTGIEKSAGLHLSANWELHPRPF
ncbi:MAG: hypothetical protein GX612_06905 [Bacteroidales bacterium]|nr:hypothetical protein [Bacteroidales bacterium]OQA91263.1 MAG: hypothetical protein BWY27_00602 [Bacteroidetes bacterium ADurb.Bin234]